MADNSSAKPLPYRGNLLWVHHDAEHRKASEHRQKVFKHIQGNYHPWRRKKKSQALLRGSGIIGRTEHGRSHDGDEESSDTQKVAHRPTRLPEHDYQTRERIQLSPASSPLTPLRYGNSDPFDTHPVPVTPQMNSLLLFAQTRLIPALFSVGSGGWAASPGARRNWQEAIDSLNDSRTSLAVLSYYATARALVSQNSIATQEAACYRLKCVSLLREMFKDDSQVHMPQTYSLVLRSYGTEILARDLKAAVVHGRMLATLSVQAAEKGVLNRGLLIYAFYHDTNMATIFFVRPSFDVDVWIPNQFRGAWEEVAATLPPLLGVPALKVDLVIAEAGEKFREIFNETRLQLSVWAVVTSDERETAVSLRYWMWIRNLVNQGRLINHYFDIKEAVHTQVNEVLGQAEDHYAQAYICAAAIILIWSLRNNPKVCGVSIHDPWIAVLHLKNAIVEAEREMSAESQKRHGRALLWALFAGSLVERILHSNFGESGPSLRWFNSRFAAQARSLGLVSWPSVREVLQSFLYTDHMKPHGSEWFGTTTEI